MRPLANAATLLPPVAFRYDPGRLQLVAGFLSAVQLQQRLRRRLVDSPIIIPQTANRQPPTARRPRQRGRPLPAPAADGRRGRAAAGRPLQQGDLDSAGFTDSQCLPLVFLIHLLPSTHPPTLTPTHPLHSLHHPRSQPLPPVITTLHLHVHLLIISNPHPPNHQVLDGCVSDPFIRNWMNLLCFLLSGLPANGTIAAEVAFMFKECEGWGGVGGWVDFLVVFTQHAFQPSSYPRNPHCNRSLQPSPHPFPLKGFEPDCKLDFPVGGSQAMVAALVR
jgi:hypothetical protein